MVLAGAVAYVGDRVGHQVGRQRLTLFGIRPRYTSTIVAIATGMIIALVVTLVAIFASEQVKTAFFKLNSLNQQIAELQTRAARSRNEGQHRPAGRPGRHAHGAVLSNHLAVAYGDRSAWRRFATFYLLRRQVRQRDLPAGWVSSPTPFRPMPTRRLRGARQRPDDGGEAPQANAMLTVTSDQNLFENDEIQLRDQRHADKRYFDKGQVIAQLGIPGQQRCERQHRAGPAAKLRVDHRAPLRLAAVFGRATCGALQLFRTPHRCSSASTRPGTYVLTAFAADDFYPHMGSDSHRHRPDSAAWIVAAIGAVLGDRPGPRARPGYALLDGVGSGS